MPYLYPRQNPLDSAKNTFSSWDNCMAKTYCKWPVIVGIVVGSLILFSVVFCIIRCICCGAECAICCCKCCTCCCSGSGGRSSGHKRMKSETTPNYPVYPPTGQPNPYAQTHTAAPLPPPDARPLDQQYRSHAAPAFAPAPAMEAPQFATFDTQKKSINEDVLPAMPSWDQARDVHVQVEEPAVPEKTGDVEMDRLHHNGSTGSSGMTGMAAAAGARRSPGPNRSPMQRSPTGDSYGYDQGFEREPLVGGGMQRSPHNSPGPYNNRPHAHDDYRRASPAQNLSPVYAQGEGYAPRRSPQPQAYTNQAPYSDHTNGYTTMPHPDHRYDSPSPPSYHTNAPTPTQHHHHHHNNNNNNNNNNTSWETPAPAPALAPAAQPVSAYPGQRSYTPQPSYPGQQTYQAFTPAPTEQQPYTGVTRKAVDGSYRDI